MKVFLILGLLFTGLANAQTDSASSSAPFDAPTWADRREVFLKKLFGPQAILETVPGTAFDTARGFPRQWGRGGTGIAKRLGSQYGQFVIGEGIEMGVSALHKEDPRYFRMPEAWTRAGEHRRGSKHQWQPHGWVGSPGGRVWFLGHRDHLESSRSAPPGEDHRQWNFRAEPEGRQQCFPRVLA